MTYEEYAALTDKEKAVFLEGFNEGKGKGQRTRKIILKRLGQMEHENNVLRAMHREARLALIEPEESTP
jgi:hypothetical protein